ncbi:DUF5985 family protein [Rhizorhabdus dicambivorans]|uniref:Uncharacterized protein n=1 Tax=Rhizorhabdus dicambivorans TaxID=1850238 RepID=A0A2A4FU65_9SPHN|nr:DUF5985 family protein [Rhizorhabdus dicambivorans]ATE65646.1 hypothetical protein CMV14_15565 [Rhizorhabdus dicambivorans]PCE40988.1 hypothetical protein COO09_17475 [Rhizorhabdus dicambivorans]
MVAHFPTVVYLLSFAASVVCAGMLGRSYRSSRAPLLFWSAACFSLLAINNLVLVIDLVVTPPTVDLQVPRLLISLAAVVTLLFGFIWNGED